jgi:Domain of unknown function (DUF4266)
VHFHLRSDLLRAAVLAIAVLASGCARAVLPSEKAYLADPIMQFDPDSLEASADAHVMSNREGAAGGTGTAGGGCGCN